MNLYCRTEVSRRETLPGMAPAWHVSSYSFSYESFQKYAVALVFAGARPSRVQFRKKENEYAHPDRR